MLREFFDGKVPNSGPSPDEAVAHGAALQAEGLAVEINAELAATNIDERGWAHTRVSIKRRGLAFRGPDARTSAAYLASG